MPFTNSLKELQPVQSPSLQPVQIAGQGSQTKEDVFINVVPEQMSTQGPELPMVGLRYLPVGQLKQSKDEPSAQVSHEESHALHKAICTENGPRKAP
jgi:hypothetical protein